MNVVPTRMELLKKKNQIKLAKKGYELLKKKRDALIHEFFKILKKAKNLRKELKERIEECKKNLYYASIITPYYEIELISNINKADLKLEVKESNVMGVKIPKIRHELKLREAPSILSNPSVEEISASYREVLKIIIEIAEIETSIKRILKEIEKTKRRVNALEFIILPKLEEEVKLIKQRLDEIERDNLVALKTIKGKIEANPTTSSE